MASTKPEWLKPLSSLCYGTLIVGSSPANGCHHKYVDQKDSTATVDTIKSAGVAPEVNLSNPLHRNVPSNNKKRKK